MMTGRSFVLVGPGRVGLAVSRRLIESGYPLQAVIGRKSSPAPEITTFLGVSVPYTTEVTDGVATDLVLLAVPDDQLAPVANALHQSGNTTADTLMVHFSGLHTAQIILQGAPEGCRALSLHPLMTFPSPQAGYDALAGAPMSVEGEKSIIAQGEQLARAIGCRPFHLASDKKAQYHAAAVVSCNYAVGLAAAGRDLMAHCGIDRDEAWQLLLPLMRQTWDNLQTMPPEDALTGPIARGDIETVRTHLEALPADTLPLYKIMGRQALLLAKERLPQEIVAKLDQLLNS